MDILPTIARLIGADLPRPIDGRDLGSLLFGSSDARSPHEAIFYFADYELHAVRSGDWKLHLPHRYLEVDGEPGRGGKPANFANIKPDSLAKHGLEGIASRHGYRVETIELTLYNLKQDPGETRNVAPQHSAQVRRLLALAEAAREDLGDSITGQKGRGVREPGRIEEAK